MVDHGELADRAAMSLIAADLRFFSYLTLNKQLEPIRAIASLSLMPFLSAFVVESAKYLQAKDPGVDRAIRPHEDLLNTSRQRLKLLDDNRRSFAEILQDAENLAALTSGWFKDMHRGALGSIKQLIQPDLGVYFVGEDVVCTTHAAFLNLGLTEQALATSPLSLAGLGPHMHNTAIDLGRYVGTVAETLELDVRPPKSAPDSAPALLVPPIRYRDLNSRRFYAAMGRRAAPGRAAVCILLTSVLSQINTARFFVPLIAGRNRVAAFKVRFVGLFHVASSLEALLDEHRNDPLLHPRAVLHLSAALDAAPVRTVRANAHLRNNLVHYQVHKRARPELNPDLPLFGLVEAVSPGNSLADLDQEVDAGLERVAEDLSELLPPSLTPGGTL